MPSKVFFMDFRASAKVNTLDKLGLLIEKAGLSGVVKKRDLTAVKLHFGEKGNTAFIRPVYIRKIVEMVRKAGGNPFLTDANTLYAGTRSDSPSHITTAIQNGFAYSVVDAPVVIADGLRGKSETEIKIDGRKLKSVFIGSEIIESDAYISVAHFKGHELAGFGGAIKNTGMGCASRRGKLVQHSSVAPKVKRKKCIACGECVSHCSQHAISIQKFSVEDKEVEKAIIDAEKCIGCGECIVVCPSKAVNVQWNQNISTFMEHMIEYTMGVLKGKEGKKLFINFITNVSPACDCVNYNDAPIVRDIGILASKDPVALDMACVDLVNGEEALPGSTLTNNTHKGDDKFMGVYPEIDWRIQLKYAEELGLGSVAYEIEKV